MPFAAALSTKSNARDAVAEVMAVRAQLPGPPELALAFVSPHHGDALGDIAAQLVGGLEPKCLVGCQGEAIVGTGREIENGPAISLWLAHWGGQVAVEPLHLTAAETPDGPTLFGWPDALVEADPAHMIMLLFGDPFTFPAIELFLPRVNDDLPGLRVHGGMASGVTEQGQTVLFLNDETKDEGAVGVLLRGPVGLRSVVSQGCRPVGEPLVITKAKESIIFELGGRPSVYAIQHLLETLKSPERELFQNGPHIGVATNPAKASLNRGDFLVRNLAGLDPNNGAIAITDRVRPGQTVQFQIRDAASADEDFQVLLTQEKQAQAAPEAALLFTCNGRGTRLFPGRDHDAKAIASVFGPIPTAGFFAAGELGPVAGRNALHGFTASAVLFGGAS